jgi:hypothetical protein
MNRKYIWIALACLIAPIILRTIWFYTGFSVRPAVATPDYQSMTIPAPPFKEQIADQKVKVRGGVVVVDTVHGNQFKANELDILAEALKQRGARVEFDNGIPNLETRLKYASAYVIISPSTGYTSDEMRFIRAFVENGGRLLVFTDATRGLTSFDFFSGSTIVLPDANIVNPLLAPFDIVVNTDYLYDLVKNEGNFRNVYFDEFNKDELTFGLKQVVFYAAHSVSTDSGTPLFIGSDKTLSSNTDTGGGLSTGAISTDGNVLVLGDFTFLTPPYNRVADNGTLIGNIADFLVGGTRKPALANFPYVFNISPVSVLPTSEVQMTAEMVGAVSRLQAALKTQNIGVKVVEKDPGEGDVIVLGTFTKSDDLSLFTESFNVNFDDSTESITVPDFGKVGRSGNGLILFKPGKKGNTVVLLADTTDDLITLLDTVSGGTLTGCVLQDNTGVCSVGYGGSFSDGTSTEQTPTGEGTDTSATPTPAAGG